jgi:hypothetical protein
MKKTGTLLQASLKKRLEAIDRFRARKAAYLESRKEILADIEEARQIYQKTMEQLPDQDFNQ